MTRAVYALLGLELVWATSSGQNMGVCDVQGTQTSLGCDEWYQGNRLNCTKNPGIMPWVARPVYTDNYALYADTSSTSYEPDTLMTIWIRVMKFGWKYRGLLVHAVNSAGATVGEWQFPQDDEPLFWNPPNCPNKVAFHIGAELKPYGVRLRFKTPPAGTGTITFKALIKTGDANDGFFYYPNLTPGDLRLTEGFTPVQQWFKAGLGATCASVCAAQGKTLDTATLGTLNTPAKLETAVADNNILCRLPVASDCSAVSPSIDADGLCYYRDTTCEAWRNPVAQDPAATSTSEFRLCSCGTTTVSPAPTPAPTTAPTPRACSTLTSPAGGPSQTCSGAGAAHGAVCTFSCNTGYAATGSFSRTCNDGTWSGSALVCTIKTCANSASPANAVAATCNNKVHGDTCTYVCNLGYSPANATMTCNDGSWVGTTLVCSPQQCPTLNVPASGTGTQCVNKVQGETCTFGCVSGATLAGTATRNCDQGAWTGTAVTCTLPNTCPNIATPSGSSSAACNGKTAGQTCVQACNTGYTQAGTGTRTCSAAGTWDGTAVTCTPIACPTLNSQETTGHATPAICSGKVQGDTCTFTCAVGWTPVNSNDATRTCNNGAWSGNNLTCAAIPCSDRLPPANSGSLACVGVIDGGSCTMGCNAGYTPKTHTINCINGQWAATPAALVCQQLQCPTLTAPSGATGAACAAATEGSTCTFACNAGTNAVGNPQRTCRDGVWDGMALTCTAQGNCPAISAPAGAQAASCTAAIPGTACSFACLAGYDATGNAQRTCGSNLQWSGVDLVCTPKSCPTLDPPAVGGLVVTPPACAGKVQGESCHIDCQAGYTPAGSADRTCNNGAWTGTPLTCNPKICPGLNPPANATQVATGQSCQGYTQGQICTFSCQAGYNPAGDPSRECRDGIWTGNLFSCVEPAIRYAYQGSDWGPCSTTCGPGIQTRVVTCIDLLNSNAIVDNDFCLTQEGHAAPTEQDCPAQPPCVSYAWTIGNWDTCSQLCGGGVQQRSVVCMGTTGSGAAAVTNAVEDFRCEALVPKPMATQSCNLSPCSQGTFHWAPTAWTNCDVSCNGGTQLRTVTCQDYLNNNVDDSQCATVGVKPEVTRGCNTAPCDSYDWTVCPYEECTAMCNGGGSGLGMVGVQPRRVLCVRTSDGKTVDDSLCTSLMPSRVTSPCNTQPCSTNVWMTTVWGPCINPDAKGVGKRQRTSHCHLANGANGLLSDCDAKNRPVEEEICSIYQCPGAKVETSAPPATAVSISSPAVIIPIAVVGGLVGILIIVAIVKCTLSKAGAHKNTRMMAGLDSKL